MLRPESVHRTHHMGWLRCDKSLDIHSHNWLPTSLQNTPIQHSTHHKNQTLANGFYKPNPRQFIMVSSYLTFAKTSVG
jgi:hypothetical protein